VFVGHHNKELTYLLITALLVVIYALLFALMSVHSSRILHSRMLANILRAPMMFFDTTPIGRILNRFSRDMETVDGLLPFNTRSWLNTFLNVLATIVIISYSTTIFLSVVVPLLVIYYLIQVNLSFWLTSFMPLYLWSLVVTCICVTADFTFSLVVWRSLLRNRINICLQWPVLEMHKLQGILN